MSKDPYQFKDSYDRYYIDAETGERAYASDGSWTHLMIRGALVICLALAAVAVLGV